MTLLADTAERALVNRRERLVMENKEHFHRGEMTEYLKNCQRITRISAELQRREHDEHRAQWRRWV